MDVIIRLLLAHIVGDFFLQSKSCCEAKRERTVKGFFMSGFHSLVIAILSYLVVADWSCWWIPVVLLLSHWLIDIIKSWHEDESASSFLLDQLAHIILIGVISFCYMGCPKLEYDAFSTVNLLYLLSYLLVLKPSSIIIKLFTQQWAPKETSKISLPNAGKWIGYLERVLILTFIFVGHVEGIGFLLAAKSIFRFGDLNKSKDVRTTEYVLLGTFMSFAISIIIGFGVKWLI